MVHPRIRHAVLNGRQVLTVPGFDAMSRRVLIPRFADVAASVVLIAGIAKIVDLEVFARSLQEWSIVGTRAKAFIVLVVPLLEITCSLVLLLRIHRAIGGALLACLLIAVSVGRAAAGTFQGFARQLARAHRRHDGLCSG